LESFVIVSCSRRDLGSGSGHVQRVAVYKKIADTLTALSLSGAAAKPTMAGCPLLADVLERQRPPTAFRGRRPYPYAAQHP
jgi:hypothetical protein